MERLRTGAIVSFREVNDFDQLSLNEATRIIYDEVVPACEAKGVMLSSYGNHVGRGSLANIQKYEECKAAHSLFDVQRIQRAFTSIPIIIQNCSQYRTGSYGLKHTVEDHPSQNEYITNGDLIVTMLLKGYEARFGEKNDEAMGVNCEFKVKVK